MLLEGVRFLQGQIRDGSGSLPMRWTGAFFARKGAKVLRDAGKIANMDNIMKESALSEAFSREEAP